MTPKKIIILLLLMLGCGWTVVMLSKQNETTDSGEPVFEQLYPQLNDIVSIKLRRPNYGNGVTLEQRQGVWVVSDPIVDDINTYALRLLSQEFAKIVDREIPGNLASQSHADLGLSNPGFIVETVEADGGIRSLLIGSKPFSANFHVAALDGSLCLVSSSFVSVISRSLESWRSSDLIPMLNPSKIAWQANQSNYSFEINKISGRWRFVSPFNALLSDLASDQLDLLLGARLTSIGAPLPPPDRFPQHLGQLQVSNLTNEIKLDIFTSAIISDQRNYVLHVSSRVLEILLTDPALLRSTKLLDFDLTHLASIIVLAGDRQQTLVKSEQGWRDSQSKMVYNSDIIQQMLLNVENASISDNVKQRPSRGPDGFVAMSVSRLPKLDKCPQLLWWVDGDGRNWIGESNSDQVYLSDTNFDLGLRSILASQD